MITISDKNGVIVEEFLNRQLQHLRGWLIVHPKHRKNVAPGLLEMVDKLNGPKTT